MATSTASKEETVGLIAHFAAEEPTRVAASLFGSTVQQRLSADSDLDIDPLFETPPDRLRLLESQEDLTTVLGRQFNLVSLDQASPILAMQVPKHGEVVRERSERAVRDAPCSTISIESKSANRSKKPCFQADHGRPGFK